jgi:hypothetical protein
MFQAMFSPIIKLLPAGVLDEFSTHPRHQPAATWVNTTRYCKYGQVLLMMGKNIAQKLIQDTSQQQLG